MTKILLGADGSPLLETGWMVACEASLRAEDREAASDE